MATDKVHDWLDPNIELAAQAGDPAAMRIASQKLIAYAERARNLADEWLYLAAEAGDPEAMYRQAKAHIMEQGGQEAWWYWLRHAADAGWLPAMEDMARYGESEDQREFWLQKAAIGGARSSVLNLAVAGARAPAVLDDYLARVLHGAPVIRCGIGRHLYVMCEPGTAQDCKTPGTEPLGVRLLGVPASTWQATRAHRRRGSSKAADRGAGPDGRPPAHGATAGTDRPGSRRAAGVRRPATATATTTRTCLRAS